MSCNVGHNAEDLNPLACSARSKLAPTWARTPVALTAGAFALCVFMLAGCTNELEGVTIESMVVGLGGGAINNPDAQPLSGVRVCLFEDGQPVDPCTTSDRDGHFALRGVPTNQRVVVSYRRDGLMPSLQPFDIEEADIRLTANVATVLVNAAFDEDVGEDYLQDPELGAVGFFGVTPSSATAAVSPVEGFTVRLDPPRATPIFVDANHTPDPDLTQSSTAGLGVFQNVEPGTYRMIFGHPELGCQGGIRGSGWRVGNGRTPCEDDAPAGAPDRCAQIEVPIVAGWVTTQVGVLCQ